MIKPVLLNFCRWAKKEEEKKMNKKKEAYPQHMSVLVCIESNFPFNRIGRCAFTRNQWKMRSFAVPL